MSLCCRNKNLNLWKNCFSKKHLLKNQKKKEQRNFRLNLYFHPYTTYRTLYYLLPTKCQTSNVILSLSTYIINFTVSSKYLSSTLLKYEKKNGQIHSLYTTSTTPTQGSNEFPCLRYIDRNTFKFLVFLCIVP